MKPSLFFSALLLLGLLIGCSKDAQPLTPAQSLLGKWKVTSLLIDGEEQIHTYKSILWEFKDYNGKYGRYTITEQLLFSNFDQIVGFFYTINENATELRLYNDEASVENPKVPQKIKIANDTLTVNVNDADFETKAIRVKQ